KSQGLSKRAISEKIAKDLDIVDLLRRATKRWDGGYTIQGAIGHGDAFVMRDRNGIRPAFYFANEDYIVAASERSAIATVFNIDIDSIKEIDPGHVLVVKSDGSWSIDQYIEAGPVKACSFERIYFSRGSDIAIYNERKMLGKLLIPQILDAINHDLQHTVFSYIPNTAETAFLGMIEGLEDILADQKEKKILELSQAGKIDHHNLSAILNQKIRVEKAAIKDVKLRTFITDDAHRDDMVAHVYDTTYGILNKGVDSLVVIDDSIVRGTTLRESIIRILSRLQPKKIVIVSSAPQIRYPDCYGIDMSNLKTLIAFNAAIDLLEETGNKAIIDDVYKKSKAQSSRPLKEFTKNFVNQIYKQFTADQLSARIAELVKHDDINCEIQVIFQTIENLHKACPNHQGDWYFTGNFPTPGGNRVAGKAFINFYEGNHARSY
ncbi:MAG: amidophosphoribosyltransferase, partial [Calditrichaeota bacterium]|nr:amidophosphoribosyltransferase [Calditrichota bacterium]